LTDVCAQIDREEIETVFFVRRLSRTNWEPVVIKMQNHTKCDCLNKEFVNNNNINECHYKMM
jgi:hypothetical protein